MSEREPTSFNRVQLLGRLGRDPEIRSTRGSGEILSLTLATEERWKDKKTDEWKGVTEWHKITSFADNHINMARGLHKGDRVYVEGKIITRKWQDQSGNDKYSTEIAVNAWGKIELREANPGRGSGHQRDDGGQRRGGYQDNRKQAAEDIPLDDILRDEIPW